MEESTVVAVMGEFSEIERFKTRTISMGARQIVASVLTRRQFEKSDDQVATPNDSSFVNPSLKP
jgi:hypothetical protein